MPVNETITSIFLLAGRGMRMRELFDDPKCLLRIGGRTVLEWNLANLERAGLQNAILVLGYRSDRILEALERTTSTLSIRTVQNPNYDNGGNVHSMVLGLQAAESAALVFDGDIMMDGGILENFVKFGSEDSVLVGSGSLEDIESTKVFVDRYGKIRKFIDKRPPSEDEQQTMSFIGEAVGILKFANKSKLRMLESAREFYAADPFNCSLNWEPLLNHYVRSNDLLPYLETSDKWIEMDTPEDYRTALAKFEK